MYINDLHSNIASEGLEFADDTKLYFKVKRSDNDNDLQKDLEKLETLPEKWQMLFNCDKWKCLHLGLGNPNLTFKIGKVHTSTIKKEKEIAVTLSANLKVSEQCRIAALKANRILELLRRNIVHKEEEIIIPLNRCIVRPHLVYFI